MSNQTADEERFMTKRDFERELFLAIEGFFGMSDWKDKRGRSYEWVMNELAMLCSDEQWLIVDETLNMIRDPDYITGDAPLDTPVSHNPWEDR